MSKIKLKEVLSREIRNRGVSTSQLARLCGIPKSTLHDWVSGRLPNSKNIHLIKDLSEFLGISISLLLFNQEEKKTDSEIVSMCTFNDGNHIYRITVEKKCNKLIF